MKPELQQVFDSTPEDEPRSRLEPYRELILRWRRQGRTYQRIRNLLSEKFSVAVSRQVLTRFIKNRSRPRKPQTELKTEQLPFTPPLAVCQVTAIPRNPPITAADPYAEERERMRQHKEAPPPEKPRKIFEVSEDDLDPTKPLRMMPHTTPKEN